ncbi:SpaA isopeptide-forming pilin-related protein [Blautia sp. MSJ-19]|uniref:SpaA isopeptide-forming pilin-related protein n=1 Tax=Blautia sp. MSJ-19 TaxID=2841517 RepID=UPI001C0F16CC|nr:SpaA isopeptide-forming pilin-related protein [Blautia sp. MSJ-19]MBU5482282.1 prealbumin-like fold domain-containing protein [Blautia sp. MSJ-19]
MKISKKWAVLLVVCLLVMTVLPVKAETTGSIGIQLSSGTTEVEMMLYKIADYADEEYTMTEEFRNCGISLEQLSGAKNIAQITEALEKYIETQKLQGRQKTEKSNEKIFFDNLSPGLYFAVQTAGQEKALAESALILLPSTESGEKNYNPEVAVKCVPQEGAVILNKTDPNGNVLEGAKFKLEKKDGTSWKELNFQMTTNKNGQLEISKLPFGQYRFIETEAPEGFVRLEEPVEFEISKAGEVEEIKGKYEAVSGTAQELQVINQPESSTPSATPDSPNSHNGSTPKKGVKTGDTTPIVPFVILLTAAVAGIAAVVMVKLRKKEKEEK